MVFSRSINAPPHIKRIFFVSICIRKINKWKIIEKITSVARVIFKL